MKKIFENKFFIIVSLFLVFGAVTVIASTIGDSGFSGIQVDNYFTGSGKQGINQNVSFNDSDGNTHSLEFEDGLLVNYGFDNNAYQTSLPASENLLAYWKLDETSGTNVIDSVGNQNLTNFNSVAVNQSGLINTAYDWSGANNRYLEATNITPLDGSNISSSFWLNVSSADQYDGVIIFFDTSNIQLGVEFTSSSVMRLNAFSTTSGIVDYTYTSHFGSWTHVAFTADTNGNAELFINGASVGTANNSNYYGVTNVDSLTLGNFDSRARTRAINGRMDEIGIWNTTLNSTEIQDLYNNGNGLTY